MIYAIAIIALLLALPAEAKTVTCKQDRYGSATIRCSDGTVCKQSRYGGTWRCTKPRKQKP